MQPVLTDESSALDEAAFKQQLEKMGLDTALPMALAVSGGADSMCLAFLAKGMNVKALVVDHGLRPESCSEAALTVERLEAIGVDAEILTWVHDDVPTSNIQAAAREARYALMARKCRDLGIATLLTAHHMDDQAETFLLRLNRGSGLAGLTGMAEKRELEAGLTLVRPLLSYRKAALVDVLKRHSVEWIEDPSNTNETFDRVKARQLLADPPLTGLTAPRLAHTAYALGRARRAIEHYVFRWLDEAVEFAEAGYASFGACHLREAPDEVGLRALAHLIRFASGQPYGPRFEKLVRLYDGLLSPDFSGTTLSGARFLPLEQGGILVLREIAATERAAIAHISVWDGRYGVNKKSDADLDGLEVGCLDEDGLAQLKSATDAGLEMPRAAALSAPGYFMGDKLIAVPHLGYGASNKKLPVLTHRWLTSSESGKKTYRGVQ